MQSNGQQSDPLQALRVYAEEVAAFSREEADRLSTGLEREQTLQAEIRTLLEDSQHRERGMRKAVEALTAERQRSTKGTAPAGRSAGWTISQAKVQEVWDLIRRQPGDFKPTDLREQGASGEAVRRSLVVLREQELIRVAGKLRGGGRLYALMPGAAEHERIVLAAPVAEGASDGA